MQINPWDGKNFGAESVRQQVETSLKRLKVIKNHYRQVIMIIIIITIIVIVMIIVNQVDHVDIIIISITIIFTMIRWPTWTSCICMHRTTPPLWRRPLPPWTSFIGIK